MEYIIHGIESNAQLHYNENMMDIRKSEGFKGEKIIVLPREFVKTVSTNPIVRTVFFTDIGFFPNAQYHYRERLAGCEENILIFCIKGKGFVSVGGKKKLIRQNNILLIPPATPHSYGSDEKEPWSIYWVHFKGEKAHFFLERLNQENLFISLTMSKSPKIILLFNELIDCIDYGYSLDSMIYSSCLLSSLLGFIFYADDKIDNEMINMAPVEYSIKYMNDNIQNNISLKELSAGVNLSVCHFSNIFHKKTGLSPIDYLIRLRVHKACQYLDTSVMKIGEIAKILGFNDQYYFSRVFTKIMGTSPTEYRAIKKG